MRVLVFVAAPLTAIMVVLREPLTSVFYQYGLFGQEATDQTASTLMYFAIGLVGHIVVHVLTRAFYAMQDTRTPVAWAVIAVAINVPLMAVLVGPMGVEGLAWRSRSARSSRSSACSGSCIGAWSRSTRRASCARSVERRSRHCPRPC